MRLIHLQSSHLVDKEIKVIDQEHNIHCKYIYIERER